MRIFITGIGAITAIGRNVPEMLDNIRQRKSGVGTIEQLETAHRAEFPLAEVRLSNEELMLLAGVDPKKNHSRTTLLGLIAAREALESAGIFGIDPQRIGILSATSVGGMDRTEGFYQRFLKDGTLQGVQVLYNHDCGSSTEQIADKLGIRGFITTISTACSSSANAIMMGARILRTGLVERVLVGGTDAMARFTLNGFETLKILDHQDCQPFDQQRRGLNLGEGAGYLVLETEKTATPDRRLAELSGYANMNDAYHQTASSPDGQGAFFAMQKALKIAGLEPKDIDYINAHGTGTQNNDLSEGRAIQQLFGDHVPKFSSTKSFTGHTLGAAGGVEAVLSVLAIQQQFVYPNLRFQSAMEELQIRPELELIESYPIRHVLSNSFGFGGNSSSLVFSKI